MVKFQIEHGEKLLPKLKEQRKGDVTDDELTELLVNLTRGVYDITTEDSYEILSLIIKLVIKIEKFFNLNFNKFFELRYNMRNKKTYEFIYDIINTGYTFNQQDLKVILSYSYNFNTNTSNLLYILYLIKVSNPKLRININSVVKSFCCIRYWFSNNNYKKFIDLYELFKFDYKCINNDNKYKYINNNYDNDDNNYEILFNLTNFFKKYDIKYDSEFLIQFVIKNINILKIKKNEKYLELITEFRKYYNNEIVKSSIYNLSEKLRYGQLLILFRELYDNLCDKHNIVSELNDPNNKKNKRKIYPILKACFRDVDHIHTYLDRKFIVYRDKRGYKRWRLIQ